MMWNSRFRCTLICFGFIALFSVFSVRLIYIQMIRHEHYVSIAAGSHAREVPIYAERGSILDAIGDVLAHDVPMRTVWADATRLNDPDAAIELVSHELKIPAAELSEKIAIRKALHCPSARSSGDRGRGVGRRSWTRKSCTGSISITIRRGFTLTSRCFAMSSALPISIIRVSRGWRPPWMTICAGKTDIVTSNMT